MHGDFSVKIIFQFTNAILYSLSVVGTCVAVVDHYPAVKEELQLCKGDLIKIEGFLFNTLNMFIGRHLTSGEIGFVHKASVKHQSTEPP